MSCVCLVIEFGVKCTMGEHETMSTNIRESYTSPRRFTQWLLSSATIVNRYLVSE